MLTKSIKQSFLIDPLATNNTIYRDSLTLTTHTKENWIIKVSK